MLRIGNITNTTHSIYCYSPTTPYWFKVFRIPWVCLMYIQPVKRLCFAICVTGTFNIVSYPAIIQERCAFKEIFKCGSCGASITAEEKFKHLLDGSINRHVYYRCTRKVDPNCSEKFMNEKDLKEQLLSFIAENTEVIEITDKLARRALAHTEVVEAALQIRGVDFGQLDPMTEYSTYVLMKGSYKAQGALVEGIKSTFVIRDRTLEIQ
jgi:hypothetical protein